MGESERTPVGNRISGIPESGIHPLIGQFQHSSVNDTDEKCDMAAVRDLSTSNTVLKSLINNKPKQCSSTKQNCLNEKLNNMVGQNG